MFDIWTAGPLALALIWLAGFWLLPVTIWTKRVPDGYNAVNYPGLILMRPGLPAPGAVWAQEFYEARWRWITFPLTAIPHFIGRVVPRLAHFERSIELMGHEIEVWAELSLTVTAAGLVQSMRHREARVLAKYGAFKGWSVFEIEAAMQARSSKAQRFVSHHRQRIEAMHAKGKAK